MNDVKFLLTTLIAAKATSLLESAGCADISVSIVQPKAFIDTPVIDMDNEVVEFRYPDGERCPYFVEIDRNGASINERARDRSGQLRVLEGRYRIADNYKELVAEMVDKVQDLRPQPELTPQI